MNGLPVFSFFRGFSTLLAKRSFTELVVKVIKLWKRDGLKGVKHALMDICGMGAYSQWVKRYDTLNETDRKQIRGHIEVLGYKPLISILMPVYNTPEEWLRAAIQSVQRQIYPHWELCIADDASTQKHVRLVLEEARKSDGRIKVAYRAENGHISESSNTALKMATGEFIALLDHDDELAEHALYMVAVVLSVNPELDLIYSDEDKIDEKGVRFAPYFKPDWNPALFLGQNMISHLGVYRTSLAQSVGGFRIGFEGSQDWDFAMRVIGNSDFERIHHIPHVLYHWRAFKGSAALGVAEKPYAAVAGRKVIDFYWQQQGINVSVKTVTDGQFRSILPLPPSSPSVSIIVPTRNGLLSLRRCLNGLFHNTDYSNKEILIIDNESDDPETISYLAELAFQGRIKLLRHDAPFNHSTINNKAVENAQGELVCLLNNDVDPINSDWLKEMVSHAIRPEIGAVGAMLYYPNNFIQHAGIFLNGIAAGHMYQGSPRGTSGGFNRARLVQNLSAVTAACMVIRKSTWSQVGGMDEANLPVAFNDVDFCLKVVQAGYRNLWTPFAELYHYESASRGKDDTLEKKKRYEMEVAFLQKKWGNLLLSDPAWNPNLAFDGAALRLAFPPRLSKPWFQRLS